MIHQDFAKQNMNIHASYQHFRNLTKKLSCSLFAA